MSLTSSGRDEGRDDGKRRNREKVLSQEYGERAATEVGLELIGFDEVLESERR